MAKFTFRGIAAAAAIVLAACGGKSSSEGTGRVEVNASALSNPALAGISLTLTRLDGGWSTTVALRNSRSDGSGRWSALVQGVPAGSYDVYAAAVDGAGQVLFETPRPYPVPTVVSAGGSTLVNVLLQEKKPTDPFGNTAPAFVGLTASQTSVAPHTPIQLAAVAVDPDAGDAITFAWSSTPDGAFGTAVNTATTTATTFTPPAAGTYTIRVSATDRHGARAVVSIAITVADGASTGALLTMIDLNSFPAVQSVTSDDVAARPLALTAVATDLDGDALSFDWAADCDGTFDAAVQDPAGTSRTAFHLTDARTSGYCTITVTVADGRGGTNHGTLAFSLAAPGVGGAPQLQLEYVTAAEVEAGAQAEVRAVPAPGQDTAGWTYAWSDGLDGAMKGTFTSGDATAAGSDRRYAPASCDALGAGDHVVTLSVTATDARTGAASASGLPLVIHCGAAWKFGVMSDTQWPSSPDRQNPYTDAVNVVRHLNGEFAQQGVKFVIQVGDLTDSGTSTAAVAVASCPVAVPAGGTCPFSVGKAAMDVRATFAQGLYDAGIGFFPLRGNHESDRASALEFQRLYPQTLTGVNNQTPADAMIGTTIYGPQIATPGTFAVGSNFATLPGFEGLTYAFDQGNARFVLYDQFTSPAGTSHSTLTAADVAWISGQAAARPAGGHTFFFAHKGLITENHTDTLFGNDPSAQPALQNTFMANLAQNGARFAMCGHDHMHHRARVLSPDRSTALTSMTLASDSYKFYIPLTGASINDVKYDVPAFGFARETPVAQELFTVGYYVVTVDGPRVTMEYFASPNGCNGDCDETNDVIPYTFSKHETFGYALNGKEFVVAQGASYSVVQDAFYGTSARILGGTNADVSTVYDRRPLSRAVNTGWSLPAPGTASAILTLWGLTPVGAETTDPYVLSMSYAGAHLADGHFGLAARNASGAWVNAVDLNAGGTKAFVVGPYDPAANGLGTYGVDPATGTVWAVVNHAGEFAAAAF
jgi:hypothetical protein